jgi:uncharacterized protein YgiM (DUF1202 family)
MCFFRALAVASFCLSLSVHLSSAQEATANRGVNLRSDPSTKHPPIGHLNAGETVTLLSETPNASFYHVKTSDGTEGLGWEEIPHRWTTIRNRSKFDFSTPCIRV